MEAEQQDGERVIALTPRHIAIVVGLVILVIVLRRMCTARSE